MDYLTKSLLLFDVFCCRCVFLLLLLKPHHFFVSVWIKLFDIYFKIAQQSKVRELIRHQEKVIKTCVLSANLSVSCYYIGCIALTYAPFPMWRCCSDGGHKLKQIHNLFNQHPLVKFWETISNGHFTHTP